MRFHNGILAACTVAILTAGAANAQFDAYSLPTPRTGNQTNFGGSLGLQFNVLGTAIQITRLGAFDSGQNGIASTGLFTQIFVLGGAAVSPIVSFTTADPGTLVGAYRYKDITPLLLTANTSYQVVSWGYGTANPNVNAGLGGGSPAPTANTGGGLITFGRNRFSATPGVNPTSLDGNPIPRYGAGTFTFRTPPPPPPPGVAPEPASLALLGVGAVAMAGVVRRKRI